MQILVNSFYIPAINIKAPPTKAPTDNDPEGMFTPIGAAFIVAIASIPVTIPLVKGAAPAAEALENATD